MLKRQALIILLYLLALNKCVGGDNECTNDLVLQEACQKLTSQTEGRICVYDGSRCKEDYATCEDYEGTDSNVCGRISTIAGDPRFECVIKEGRCTNYTKLCSDFIDYYEEEEYCESLSTGNPKSRCYYNRNYGTCTEQYYECKDQRDPTKCPTNFPSDESYKCFYDENENECKSGKRRCIEYDKNKYKNDNCWILEPEKEGKSCILDFWCREVYAQCEDYTGTTIDEDTCKKITPYIKGTGNLDYSHKCVKEGNSCVTKQRTCEDYNNGLQQGNQNYCNEIILDGDTKKACKYGVFCFTNYYSCDTYKGENKTICENIILVDENGQTNYSFKCEFENGKCTNKPKKCQDYNITKDYKFNARIFCENIILSDKTKRCLYLYSGEGCLEIPTNVRNIQIT